MTNALHPWILSQKDQQKIDRISKSVRDDRYDQVSSSAQIDDSKQETGESLVNDPRNSLVGMRKSKPDMDVRRASMPLRSRSRST